MSGDIDDSELANPPRSLNFDDLTALVVSAALAVATLPFAYFPSSTPRMVVLLCALPLGTAALISAVRARDRCAMVALAYVMWVLVCALMANARWASVLGSYGYDTSAVIVAGSFGVWSLGRRLSDAGRVLMPRLLLGSFALSAVVGLLQILFRAHNALFGVVGGRAHGLAGGHIYFGATMAGAACLAAVTLKTRSLPWFALIFLFATGANLSGSRFPIVVGFLVGLGIIARRRELRSALAWCGVYISALVASSLLLTIIPGTETAADRAGQESSGRFQAWKYGWSALLDHPVFGWGPRGFRAAVQGRFSPSFTGAHAADELTQIWFDAHNIVVAIAVSYGFIGLALAAAFTLLAARTARGPLVAFVIVVATSWLLEPAGLATFPLVMICLGGSMMPIKTTRVFEPRAGRASLQASPELLMLLVGVLLGALYLLSDQRIDRAMSRRDPDAVAAAVWWTPWDPVSANLAGAAYANFDGREKAIRESLKWMERAHELDPKSPFYLNKIAQLRLILADRAGAQDALHEALDLQPWNVQSLQLAYHTADNFGANSFSENARDRLCTIGAKFCPRPSPTLGP